MSVLDRETVDGMAVNESEKTLRLLISDHLDWSEEYNHLLVLQEKKLTLILYFAKNINIMNSIKQIQ